MNMKKNLIVAFAIFGVIFLLTGPAIANSQILWKCNPVRTLKILDAPHEEILNGRRFLWEAPNSSPPEEGYPVLFVMHGGTQHADVWFRQNLFSKRQSKFVTKALEKGFFIVAPDSERPEPKERKRWDYTAETFNDSLDLPFIQDIINWLNDSSPINIDNSRLFCIGISGGGLMTSRIAHFFGSVFKAVAVLSGGNADFVSVPRWGLPKFDVTSPQNFSSNHPPTLVIHGARDRLVPVEAGVHFFEELQNAAIRTHLLLNSKGGHSWQWLFNDKIIEWFINGSEAPLPPSQPSSGPGGANYSHREVIKNRYGRGAKQYWIFEPAEPQPETAPLIVFNHGWGAIHPRFYRAWIDHIVKRGNIVVYPRYQRGLFIGFRFFSSNSIHAVKSAINELENGEHVVPDLDKFAITGHSLGGGITANMASRAEEEGLPIPKAIMPVQPAIIYDKKADFSKISNGTLMLVIVGEDDTVVENKS
ncbi:MAG: prolyl oligopeptidase family serine peptidase, partial [Petrotogales bacterium]